MPFIRPEPIRPLIAAPLVAGVAAGLLFAGLERSRSGPALAMPPHPHGAGPTLARAAGHSGASFRRGEKAVTGSFTIRRRNGRQQLVLSDDFRTSDQAPDLKLVLGRSPDPISGSQPPAYPLAAGTYTVIAPLQASAGGQTYDLPEELDLAGHGSVIIWCEQFNATMAWAPLSP